MPHSANYQISLTDVGGDAVVHVSGEVDLAAKTDLGRALARAAGGGRNVIIDLSGTTFMDSTGLKVLVDALRSQTDAGLAFALRNPSSQVLATLHMAGLEDMFPTTRTDN